LIELVEKHFVLAFFSVVAINQICPQERAKIIRNLNYQIKLENPARLYLFNDAHLNLKSAKS
jgi:hypothetical protein